MPISKFHRLTGVALGAALLAGQFLATPPAQAAPTVDEAGLANGLLGAYVQAKTRGPQLQKHFVLSNELLNWRKRNPTADEATISAHLDTAARTVDEKIAAYQWHQPAPELVSRLAEVLDSPDLGEVVGVVAAKDTMNWVGRAEDRISGAAQQFQTNEELRVLRGTTWSRLAAQSRADEPLRRAWQARLGNALGVDPGAGATELAAKPEITALLDAPGLLAKKNDPVAFMAQVKDEVGKLNKRADRQREEALTDINVNINVLIPGEPKTAEQAKVEAAEKLEKSRQDIIDGVGDGVDFLAGAAGLLDGELGKKIGGIGKSAVQIATAINKFATATKVLGAVNAVFSLASVALTGNVIGAIGSIVGLFMGGGPSMDQLIMEEIGELRKDIDRLGKEMTTRFDRVDKKLNEIHTDMMREFDKIKSDVAEVRRQGVSIAQQLSQLESKVQTLGVSTLESLRALDRKELLVAANNYLDYQHKFGRPIPDFTEYINNAENKFHYAGTTTQKEATWVVPEHQYESADPEALLAAYGPQGLIRYLTWYANKHYSAAFPIPATDSVGNPVIWSMAARAYALAAVQNPAYAKQVNRSRADEVAAAGQRILDALKEISNPRSRLFAGLPVAYQNAAYKLGQEGFKPVEHKVVANTTKQFALFDGPTQRPAGADQLPDPNDAVRECGGNSPYKLAKPGNVTGRELGPAVTFARYIHGVHYGYCFNTYGMNARNVDDGQNIYRKVDIRLAIFQRVDLPGGTDGRVVRNLSTVVYRGFDEQITSKRTGQVFNYDPSEFVARLWPICDAHSCVRRTFEQNAQKQLDESVEREFAERMQQYLDARRIEYYDGSVELLNSGVVDREVNLHRRLLQAYTELAVPRALENDDHLRALLYGEKRLLANSPGAQLYTEMFRIAAHNLRTGNRDVMANQPQAEGCRSAPPGVRMDPVAYCLRFASAQRMDRFQGQLFKHLRALEAGTATQSMPMVDQALRNLRLANESVHK